MDSRQADLSGVRTLPPARLGVGLTGHRAGNAAYDANLDGIRSALGRVVSQIDAAANGHAQGAVQVRLATLLANGSDLLAVDEGSARGWKIVAPLPFGTALNVAINAQPRSLEDARALIAGEACADPAAASYAARVEAVAQNATLFELAEQDEHVAALYLATLADPADTTAARAYNAVASDRAGMAGKVMIEQSDLVIAIWDGITPGAVGGTRHTMVKALNEGLPVVWIDASAPDRVRVLRSPEAMLAGDEGKIDGEDGIAALLADLIEPDSAERHTRAIRFHTERWHPRSQRRFHAYRRIETLFGGGGLLTNIVQTYEAPGAIAEGSGKPLLDTAARLPGGDPAMAAGIRERILERFAWADGLSTYLSDAYRGGMITNFLLSALAIIGGAAYLPFGGPEAKWPFALLEFVLLLTIVAITATGQRHGWHRRWFETRRVAEYLRHAPILLLLGVARSSGRWPRGAHSRWPEHYARGALRELGLPKVQITQAYLRAALEGLLAPHVRAQRDYHAAKTKRLVRVHHNLDRMSELFFALAVLSVAAYLLLAGLEALGLVHAGLAAHLSKTFTLLGVAFPALGGAFAGIRYFGDFERFAAISEVAAEKLALVAVRIDLLLASAPGLLNYGQVAALAHALDDIVTDEIENWQAVFAGKQISVPV